MAIWLLGMTFTIIYMVLSKFQHCPRNLWKHVESKSPEKNIAFLPEVTMMQIGLRRNVISLNPMAHMMLSGLMGGMVNLNPMAHMMKTLPLIGLAGMMSLNPNQNLVGDPVFLS